MVGVNSPEIMKDINKKIGERLASFIDENYNSNTSITLQYIKGRLKIYAHIDGTIIQQTYYEIDDQQGVK